VNFRADYYPNQHPAENGYGTEEFYSPLEAIHFVHISNLNPSFLEIDSLNASVISLSFYFSVGLLDTTVIAPNGVDSIKYNKDVIPEFNLYPVLIHNDTKEIISSKPLVWGKYRSKYTAQVRFQSKKVLSYTIYKHHNPTDYSLKTLLYHGLIQLRKRSGKHYRSYEAKQNKYPN